MKSSRDEQERLEKIVHRTLRELPPRRAPRSLEQRVLTEIERRIALPWWRKSFPHWPIAAQASFVLVCVVLVMLALTGRGWVMAGLAPVEFTAAFAQPLSWMENVLVVVRAITGFFGIMLRNIPPIWLYGSIILFWFDVRRAFRPRSRGVQGASHSTRSTGARDRLNPLRRLRLSLQ